MPYKTNPELPKDVQLLPDEGKTFNASVNIVSKQLQNLSSIDILEIIPEETLSKIKAKDPHPYFQAYSICHEGQSTPTVIGEGPKPINWFKRAIQSIKKVVTKGVKFFAGHNEDNSTEGRNALGEVVADTQLEINGNLHHVVVGYFPDKNKVANMDICSQEADWDLIETAKNYIADKITKLTGIALSSSEYDKPAFSGARRIAMVQAFENKPGEPGDKGVHEMDLTTIPFDTLVTEIKRRKTFPSQIYSVDEVKADNSFKELFDDTELNSLKKEVEEGKTKLENLEKEKVSLSKKIEVSTAPKRFESLLDKQENPLTPEQKTYLKGHFDKKAEKLEDVTDEGLTKFINSKLEDYDVDAKLEIFKNNNMVSTTNNNNVDSEDNTKAANNPYLKEDYEL